MTTLEDREITTITLKTVNDWMYDFNYSVASGSTCTAWEHFVTDSYDRYQMAPYDDRAAHIVPSQEFVAFWRDVAEQNPGAEYDANGDRC